MYIQSAATYPQEINWIPDDVNLNVYPNKNTWDDNGHTWSTWYVKINVGILLGKMRISLILLWEKKVFGEGILGGDIISFRE